MWTQHPHVLQPALPDCPSWSRERPIRLKLRSSGCSPSPSSPAHPASPSPPLPYLSGQPLGAVKPLGILSDFFSEGSLLIYPVANPAGNSFKTYPESNTICSHLGPESRLELCNRFLTVLPAFILIFRDLLSTAASGPFSLVMTAL